VISMRRIRRIRSAGAAMGVGAGLCASYGTSIFSSTRWTIFSAVTFSASAS
jgi:glycerate kinase